MSQVSVKILWTTVVCRQVRSCSWEPFPGCFTCWENKISPPQAMWERKKMQDGKTDRFLELTLGQSGPYPAWSQLHWPGLPFRPFFTPGLEPANCNGPASLSGQLLSQPRRIQKSTAQSQNEAWLQSAAQKFKNGFVLTSIRSKWRLLI